MFKQQGIFHRNSLELFADGASHVPHAGEPNEGFGRFLNVFPSPLFLLKNTSIQYDIFFLQTLPDRLRIFWTPKRTYLILNVSKGDRNNHHLCDFMSSLEALLPTPS